MNRKEILEMQPGRTMDRLIAEVVLKKVPQSPGYHDPFNRIWIPIDQRLVPFQPSTNISDAWKLFELWGYQAQVGYQGGEYFCIIMRDFDEEGNAIQEEVVECNSAPEAICKAALLTFCEVKNADI